MSNTNDGTASASLGQVVSQARLDKGLTQIELADLVGMSQEWVTKIETGRIRQPRLKALRAVADVLSLDLDHLVLLAGYAESSAGAARVSGAVPSLDPLDTPALRASFSHIPELTDENLDKVAAYIEDIYRLQELGQFQNTKAGARRRGDS